MLAAVLLLLGLALLALAAHPFTTFPLSLRLLARRQPRPIQAGPPPRTAALCVCAYNEEKVIRAKARNMLEMQDADPSLELLVYVDAATDRTAAILEEFAGRIRLVVAPVRQGKTHGMNLLVAMTQAEILVFSDANVLFAPDAVQRLLAPFGDRQVGGVCGHLIYAGAEDGGAVGSRYWRMEERIKALESQTGSVMGADGSIFAIRRALHRPPPPDLIDDMFVSLGVICDGARLVRADDARAYEAPVLRPAEEFRRKVRIACQAFNVHRALAPRLRRLPMLDRYKYASHKLLRWLTAYTLAASALCLAAGLMLLDPAAAAVALALGLIAIGAILAAPRGPLASLRDILAAFVATAWGVWRSLRGDRFQTWSPPASARQTPIGAPAAARGKA